MPCQWTTRSRQSPVTTWNRCRAGSAPSWVGKRSLDSTRAHYVWEWPYYPQYYIPLDDVAPGLLVDEDKSHGTTRGTARTAHPAGG